MSYLNKYCDKTICIYAYQKQDQKNKLTTSRKIT